VYCAVQLYNLYKAALYEYFAYFAYKLAQGCTLVRTSYKLVQVVQACTCTSLVLVVLVQACTSVVLVVVQLYVRT